MVKYTADLLKILLLSIFVFYSLQVFASEKFYTIQAGTYTHFALDYAGRLFNHLSRKLTKDEREHLRIEEGSKYYIVRLGRFQDIASAEKVLKTVKKIADDAFILEETDFENSKIVIVYEQDGSQKKVADTVERSRVEKVTVPSVKPLSDEEQMQAEEMTLEKGFLEEQKNDRELIDRLIDEVSIHYSNQDYKKAAEIAREGLKDWPDEPDLLAWYGATLLDLGFPDKAYEQYKKAVKLLPEEPEFHAGIGHSLLDIYVDRAKQSVDAFKKALEIEPDNISALEGLGIVYVSIDKENLAREIYHRLKEIDNDAAERLNQFIVWGIDWGVVK
jgi:tetratricopeptide (TPR) repeat protein